MPGSLRFVARQRQAAGLSQSSAGLDIPHELVIALINYESARISRCLKYVIYAFAAGNYRSIIHFLMKWVELWTFHIRYQTLSSFSAFGDAA